MCANFIVNWKVNKLNYLALKIDFTKCARQGTKFATLLEKVYKINQINFFKGSTEESWMDHPQTRLPLSYFSGYQFYFTLFKIFEYLLKWALGPYVPSVFKGNFAVIYV